ncbi:MAG: ABC transporter permease [Clostridiales bacterium]|nr:ABC transporter permease [Clostridiales bacterium]
MKRRLFSYPYIVWMAIFILAPMLFIVYYAFWGGDGSFSLSYLRDALFARDIEGNLANLRSFGHSGIVAIETTGICLLLGYPIAYLLSRMKRSMAAFVSTLFVVPMWMNFLLRTYALRSIFLSLESATGIQILDTQAAVLIGMVYDFLPFMILPLYTILQKMDKSYMEAAQDLGANPAQTFTKVVLPLSVPGIVSGITMVFVPSVTAFAVSQLLGGRKTPPLIGDLIHRRFMSDPPMYGVGSALSLILMVFVLASMVLMRVFDKDSPNEKGGKLW